MFEPMPSLGCPGLNLWLWGEPANLTIPGTILGPVPIDVGKLPVTPAAVGGGLFLIPPLMGYVGVVVIPH